MTSLQWIYFPAKYAIEQHDKIILISGGVLGIKDLKQLESSLAFIGNDDYYPTVEDKITHLVHSVAMNHCFVDGNKRSSIVLAAYFLEINGMSQLVPTFILEMENIVLWTANHFIDKDELKWFIAGILESGGLDEGRKLRLAEVLLDVEANKPDIMNSSTSNLQFFYDHKDE